MDEKNDVPMIPVYQAEKIIMHQNFANRRTGRAGLRMRDIHHHDPDVCDRLHHQGAELAGYADKGYCSGGDVWNTAGRGSLRS